MREPLIVAGVGALSLAALHAIDPREPGHYPTCPVLAATGLVCPGCGTLRSAAAFLDADLRGSFGYHPLVPILLVLGLLGLVRWGLRRWRGAPGRPWPPAATAGVVVVYAVLFVARNVPGWTWLSPA